MVLRNTLWEAAEADARGTVSSELRRQAAVAFELEAGGLLGLATASMAISALAVREPPPALDKNAYFIALTGAFFAGVAEVITAVSIISGNNPPSVRRAAGRKLLYASIAPLAVVVCLSAASLLR